MSQQERREQADEHRLRVAGLHGEVKESMNRLRDMLNLEKSPSVWLLMMSKNMLVSAWGVMIEANKLSLEVAELRPDIAKDVMDAHAAERSSYDGMEREILIKLDRFESLYPETFKKRFEDKPSAENLEVTKKRGDELDGVPKEESPEP